MGEYRRSNRHRVSRSPFSGAVASGRAPPDAPGLDATVEFTHAGCP